MNKFSQCIITISVVVIAVFSALIYFKINTIVQMDYKDTGNNTVLDNIDLNVIRILDKVGDIYLEHS